MSSDPFGIEKAQKKQKPGKNSSAAIAGAGATTAGVGAIAGGIPGAKPNVKPFGDALDPKHPSNKPEVALARTRKQNMKRVGSAAAKASPGGILGFRTGFHEGGNFGYKMDEYRDAPKKMANTKEAFSRGRNAGKIAPEAKIIRHMKGGRLAGNAALVGGLGVTAAGVKRYKEAKGPVKKRNYKNDTRDSALAGGGAAGVGIAHGAKKVLQGQQARWETSAAKNIDRAGKIAPATAGRKDMRKHPGVKGMYPTVGDGEIQRNDMLKDLSTKKAEKVGRLRGAATQERHFAEVYGGTAKVVGRVRAPMAAVGAVGAAGLIHSRTKNKKIVSKKRNMSDSEIRHRKKVGSAITRTTSTMGLTATGLLGAGALAAKKPGALKAIQRAPGLAKVTPEKLKGAAATTSVATGGLAGLGGYNFAAYTGAEGRKRAKPAMSTVKKSSEDLVDEGSAAAYEEEISKWGSAKVRLEQGAVIESKGNKTTTHSPDTIQSKYTGKSLILRRPKYNAAAYPDKNFKVGAKGTEHHVLMRRNNVRGADANAIHAANQGKKKSVKLSTGTYKHNVSKSAFGVSHD